MSVTAYLPGMHPSCTGRNVLLGLAYLVCLTVVVPVLARTYRPVRGC